MTDEPKATPMADEEFLTDEDRLAIKLTGTSATTQNIDLLEGWAVGRIEELEKLLLAERQKVERVEMKRKILIDAMEAASIGRCWPCGWPLAENENKGCTITNCSYRPSEDHPTYKQWHIRQSALHSALAKETT